MYIFVLLRLLFYALMRVSPNKNTCKVTKYEDIAKWNQTYMSAHAYTLLTSQSCQDSVVVRTPVGLSSPFSRRGAMTRVMGFLGLFSSRLCCPLELVFIDMLLTSLTGLRSKENQTVISHAMARYYAKHAQLHNHVC